MHCHGHVVTVTTTGSGILTIMNIVNVPCTSIVYIYYIYYRLLYYT